MLEATKSLEGCRVELSKEGSFFWFMAQPNRNYPSMRYIFYHCRVSIVYSMYLLQYGTKQLIADGVCDLSMLQDGFEKL